MRRDFALLLASVSVASGALALPEGPFARIAPGGEAAASAVPVTVSLSARDLTSALGGIAVRADALTLCTDDGQRVLWQVSQPDDDTLLLSFVPPAGARALRLYPTADPDLAPLASEGAVAVTESEGRIEVSNSHYAITHERARMAGLPSRIAFRETGKVFEGFSLNDRIWEPSRQGWLLRDDASSEVRVMERGPLAVTVRVSAHYVQGADRSAGNARATYEFHYFAGSPVVVAEARAEQDAAVNWPELHFLEIIWPDESFGEWGGGGSETPQPLLANKQTYVTSGWAALRDGASVLGLICEGGPRIYDGRGDYGTYLHGPWVSWTSTERRFRALLWIGASEEGFAPVAEAAAGGKGAPTPSVTTALVDAARERLAIAQDPDVRWASVMVLRQTPSDRPGELLARLEGLAVAGDPLASALGLAGDESLLRLDAAPLRALLRERSGAVRLASLYDAEAGRELLARPQVLWSAKAEDGEKHPLGLDSASFGRCEVSRTADGLTLAWSEPTDPASVGSTAAMEVRTSEGRLTTQLRVQAGPGLSLRTVSPLTLDLAELSEGGERDHLLIPLVSGQCLPRPTSRGVSYTSEYPSGWCTMQFGALYDDTAGLYFGCEDPTAWYKSVAASSDDSAVHFEELWTCENAGVAGNGFAQTGWTALERFQGDWFDAGRIYRRWLEREAPWWPDTERADTPSWMKDIAIWALTGGAPSECVGEVKRMAEYMGVPLAFHWYSWHQIPFDVEYPHYFPTKEGMAEGVRELQAAGVRVMPYINGRLWDSALEDFRSTGIAAATKDEAGKPNLEEYGSGAKLAAMCPTQELWRQTVTDLVLRLTGPEVGVDGVYIDQIAAAAPRWCFDATHGHPIGGGHWWTTDGYWPLLDVLRARLGAERDEKMITTECNAEAFANRIDGFLTWHFQYADQVPLFASLYGGRVQLFSRAYNGTDEQSYLMKGAQSLVWGEQIGWIAPSIIDNPVVGPYFRRLARMRYALRDFLAVGEMAAPPTVSGDIPDVTSDWAWAGVFIQTYPALQAGTWRANDGRVATIFANTLTEPLRFTWVLDGRTPIAGPLTRVTEDGEAAGPTVSQGDEVEIELQPGEIVAFTAG